MGTTSVAATCEGDRVVVANIGDSRAYVLHEGRLAQITEDHSWVQEQVRSHLLDPAEARWHPMRNVITKALGVHAAIEPDIFEADLGPGDTLLLCSDGLTGVLSDAEIQAVLAGPDDLSAITAELIRAANDAGGPDNITVAIARHRAGTAASAEHRAASASSTPFAGSLGQQVSIVVTNWNGRAHLERCLPAVLAQVRPAEQAIVVDNGSTDGSADYVRRAFPQVQVVSLPVNLGFAAGTNRGIQAASGSLIVTLNNDTIPQPDWLANLLSALTAARQRGIRIGAVASLMVRAADPSTIDSAGIELDRAGLAWDRDGGQPVTTLPTTVRPVFGACAGAALYTREMLADVGGFDESFFAYLDDVDLAWRAHQRGWQTILAPAAVVHHAHSGSFGATSAWKRRLLGRNKVRLIARNYPGRALLRNLHWVLLFDALAIAGALVTPNSSGLLARLASLAGRLEGLAALPSLLHERAEIQRRAVVPFELVGLQPVTSPSTAVARYRHLWARPRRSAAGAT